MINIRHKNDLITIDLRLGQIRYLPELFNNKHEPITFHDLSNGDVDGMNYLYENNYKRILFQCVYEEMYEVHQLKLNTDLMRVVDLSKEQFNEVAE